MPRVTRLITRLNIGGPARQALLLTEALADDFPTTLAAGTPPDREGELTRPGVDVIRVPLVRQMSAAKDIRALRSVRRLLRHAQPDIVHTHMAKAGAIGRISASTLRPRPRRVHTFHGHVLEGYFSPLVERAFVQAERSLAKFTDVLVAISPRIRDELLDLGIGHPEQYRVVPLGLDLDACLAVRGRSGLLRERLGLSADIPIVGVLGRLAPIKDHLTLIAAMERVAGAHLAVLGDGELHGRLASEVQRRGLADRIHFVGWWTDVASALADMDVVALTSINEGTPVSLIEAAAASRPTVATDVGGVRDVVVDGRTGYLVPPGDVPAVADRLTALLGSSDKRREMGAAGREHVRERFHVDRLIHDVRALYRELTM